MTYVSWDDTVTEALRKLWAAGMSASQCATALATEHNIAVSRSAVIGKVHRLGLAGRRQATSALRGALLQGNGLRAERTAPPPHKPVKRRVTRRVMTGNRFDLIDSIDLSLPEALPAEDIPADQRRTLLELENGHCRYPYGHVGDIGFFFCGAPDADCINGRPYCRFHERVTHARTPSPKVAA